MGVSSFVIGLGTIKARNKLICYKTVCTCLRQVLIVVDEIFVKLLHFIFFYNKISIYYKQIYPLTVTQQKDIFKSSGSIAIVNLILNFHSFRFRKY